MEKRANFFARRDEDLARYVEMLLASLDEIRHIVNLDEAALDSLANMAEEFQDSLVSVHFYRAQAAAAAERKDRSRRALEEQLVPFIEGLRAVVGRQDSREAVLIA